MRWTFAALFGPALVAQQVSALTFTVEATRHGVPIPPSEIKLEPFVPGRTRMGHAMPPQGRPKTRRDNVQVDSANWCGSVNRAPSSSEIQLAHGTFQHPTCSVRYGQTYPQASANWVGIDGDSYTSALLQAGTVCKIDNSTGIVKHEAWWQWVPSAAYTITSMPVAPDDWFEVTLDTTSTTSAEITISNLSQGQTYSIRIQSGPTLARADADWVVERPYYGTALSGYPTFTDVWFEQAYATKTTTMGVQGAKQYQITGL
ncbi:concanavalin A-like lectin/glucanase domain-containing protein, partial [Corynascus similis CBS 632.67]